MRWINQSQDLGTLVANQTHKVEFEYKGDIEIQSIVPTCQCSVAQWNREQKKVIVNYTPGSVPFHLEERGYYNSVKKIIVELENKQSFILTFTAKIVNSI